jgi:PTH1 family peptidyl-tRNA hydrolase
MKIIAGLGNPGLKYRHTRHNAGFDAIDYLAGENGITVRKNEFRGLTGRGRINGIEVILVKPQTFMNNSGECLGEMMKYYNLDPEKDLIVVSDDVMLDPGKVRIRKKGSAGGHNGLKSIIQCTGTQNFLRLRLGVGKLPEDGDMVAHVLGRLRKDDRIKFEETLEKVPEIIGLMIEEKVDEAMNRFN